ncbi:MAG: DUF4810 domain-containing protein [Pseudomonadota bacterium]
MKLIFLNILVFAIFSVGCAMMPPSGYYWGHYSETLYAYKKAPSPETLKSHQKEIEEILSFSKQSNRLPPPGLTAELGQIFLNRGDKVQAVAYFQAEAQHFPESLLLMQHLIQQVSSTNTESKPK